MWLVCALMGRAAKRIPITDTLAPKMHDQPTDYHVSTGLVQVGSGLELRVGLCPPAASLSDEQRRLIVSVRVIVRVEHHAVHEALERLLLQRHARPFVRRGLRGGRLAATA